MFPTAGKEKIDAVIFSNDFPDRDTAGAHSVIGRETASERHSKDRIEMERYRKLNFHSTAHCENYNLL